MSRNRNRDSCCGEYITIKDLIGKPLEFRQYGDYAPQPGVKWSCPTCERTFFVWIRREWKFWSDPAEYNKDHIILPDGRSYENKHKGKFARITKDHHGNDRAEHLGFYAIDTSFYESYNDEGEGLDIENPAYLCNNDDEKTRFYSDELREDNIE